MSDHHIDSMDIDYPEVAKQILQRRGLYIHGALPINHKPGNDLISDVYYPFPIYPDNRFENPSEGNLDIKFPPDPPTPTPCYNGDSEKDYQILSEELNQIRNIKNPIITCNTEDRYTFIDRAVYPYTGLVLQAVEKKAYDISYVKPYFQNGERKTKLIITEIISGHFYSIATYDGWRYHIYRGICKNIVKSIQPVSSDGKKLRARTVPFGNPVEAIRKQQSTIEEVREQNLHIVLDVSAPLEAGVESIPINQIIDIQRYDHIYDFTIYEGNLKIFWDDWLTIKDYKRPGTFFTYVPGDGIPPQTLYHEVVEHQKIRKDLL